MGVAASVLVFLAKGADISVAPTELSWLAKRWELFREVSEDFRKLVEPVAWIIGSVLALIPGSFAIYKWIYYRYSRLPFRLDDMLRKEERRLKAARSSLLDAIQHPTPLKPFKSPIFVTPRMQHALRRMKWASWWRRRELTEADLALDKALTEINEQMKYWQEHQANYKRQQAAAHLLKGAIAATRGQKETASGGDGDQYHRSALSHFLQALEIDDMDVEAIEYAAHQHRVLGEFDDARNLYFRLAALTDKPEPAVALTRARAFSFAGEMLERAYDATGIAVRLNDAKIALEDALRSLPIHARNDFQHAFIHRHLASVENKRRTAQLPLNHCRDAERIYLDLISRHKDETEARQGLADIRKLRDEILIQRNGAAPEQEPATQQLTR